MKRYLLFIFCFLAVSESAFAVPFNQLNFASDVSTASGKTITANIAAVAGRKIAVYNIFGRSDLATSVVQIQEANAAGTTTSYTTKARLDVGAATKQWSNSTAPIFVGKINYGYRFLLDSTTANSVLVTYGYE